VLSIGLCTMTFSCEAVGSLLLCLLVVGVIRLLHVMLLVNARSRSLDMLGAIYAQ
jgi:hypothetical protein